MNESSPVTLLAEGRFLRLVRRGRWEYAVRTQASGAVVLVAVTEEGKLLLVEQYRVPVGRPTLELPAGVAGDTAGAPDEALAAAAERELREETGYTAHAFEPLLTGPSGPGMVSEMVTFFRARGLTRVSAGGGEAGEGITVHEVPLTSLAGWLAAQQRAGVLVDPKIYVGLYFLGMAPGAAPGGLAAAP